MRAASLYPTHPDLVLPAMACEQDMWESIYRKERKARENLSSDTKPQDNENAHSDKPEKYSDNISTLLATDLAHRASFDDRSVRSLSPVHSPPASDFGDDFNVEPSDTNEHRSEIRASSVDGITVDDVGHLSISEPNDANITAQQQQVLKLFNISVML
jgi:hypothetical protein